MLLEKGIHSNDISMVKKALSKGADIAKYCEGIGGPLIMAALYDIRRKSWEKDRAEFVQRMIKEAEELAVQIKSGKKFSDPATESEVKNLLGMFSRITYLSNKSSVRDCVLYFLAAMRDAVGSAERKNDWRLKDSIFLDSAVERLMSTYGVLIAPLTKADIIQFKSTKSGKGKRKLCRINYKLIGETLGSKEDYLEAVELDAEFTKLDMEYYEIAMADAE